MREKMNKKAIILAVLLAGCSDPKDASIPADLTKIDQLQEPIKKLSEEDRKLFASYMMRRVLIEGLKSSNAGDIPARAMTIREAIAQQKQWQDDQTRREGEAQLLKAKLLAQASAARKVLDDAVVVTVVSNAIRPQDVKAGRYRDQQVITLGFQNKTPREIAGVKGTLIFIDMFGEAVGRISFAYDKGIKPGESIQWIASRELNQFDEGDKAMARLEDGKYKTKFEPDAVVFSDGTKLEMPSGS